MSNLIDNFNSYAQYMPQNGVGYPMMPSAMAARCGYPSGTRSPGLEGFEGNYSPLSSSQYSSVLDYQNRMNSGSPLIQLRPCGMGEENISNSSTMGSNGVPTSKAVKRSKLNYNSKAFVKDKSVKRNSSYRKTSQDTKAHSDEEGNSTDGSDDISPNTYYNRNVSNNYDPSFDSSQNGKFVNSDEKQMQAKFKTEICKNWQTGTCKFGAKCAFAHGVEELTEKKYLPSNYKTKVCKQFHEEMYCSYGSRCQFIHLEDADSVKENTLCSAIYSLAGLRSSKKANKSRLSIFKELAN